MSFAQQLRILNDFLGVTSSTTYLPIGMTYDVYGITPDKSLTQRNDL